MSVKKRFGKLAMLTMLLGAMTVTSCEENIFADDDDCTLYSRIKFKYDMNMKFADAFANSVDHVELCIYDAVTGKLVHRQVESGSALSRQDYVMEFAALTCGTYDLLAWCGNGLHDGNFDVPAQHLGESEITSATCTMDREEGGLVTKDVKQLFHGTKRITIDKTYGVHNDTISLTKNTNTVRVVLQHLSGLDVDPNDFIFEIKDENGLMAHDNALLDDEVITYSPWSVTAGSAGVDADIYKSATRAQTSVSVALAEFTIGRLVTQNTPVLSIYNVQEGENVLSIPLKDYALLVKGNYNKKMDDQEYLDRQDEYNLTFFLDEHGQWVTSRIIINSWSVVFNNTDLKTKND